MLVGLELLWERLHPSLSTCVGGLSREPAQINGRPIV
jgi:hypothetical protein